MIEYVTTHVLRKVYEHEIEIKTIKKHKFSKKKQTKNNT